MTEPQAGLKSPNGSPANSHTHLHDLLTESANDASQGFDTKSALEIARIINHEDSKVAGAVKPDQFSSTVISVWSALRTTVPKPVAGLALGGFSSRPVRTAWYVVCAVARLEFAASDATPQRMANPNVLMSVSFTVKA